MKKKFLMKQLARGRERTLPGHEPKEEKNKEEGTISTLKKNNGEARVCKRRWKEVAHGRPKKGGSGGKGVAARKKTSRC